MIATKPARRRLWRAGVGVLSSALVFLMLFPAVVALFMAHPPGRPIRMSPANFGMAYEEVSFRSLADGAGLRGWYVPAPDPGSDRAVVLAHGFLNDRLIHGRGLPLAKALHDAGFSVVLFDLRGHGESQQLPVTYGRLERGDVAGAVALARERGAERVGILGFSIGGVAGLLAAAEDPAIGAVVADAVFTDLHTYLVAQATDRFGLPRPYAAYFLWWFRLLTGMDERSVSPAQAVARIAPRPLLLIHGTADRVIPVGESQTLLEAAGNPNASRWVVAGGRHTHSYEHDPGTYTARVVAFFAQNLQ